MKCIHLINNLINRTCCNSFQIIIKITVYVTALNFTVKILINHCNSSVYKIAKCICKVTVKSADKHFISDCTVLCERHFVKWIISYRVNTEMLYKILRINYVTSWLTHLFITDKHPRMSEHLFRKRFAQCHKHNRPINCMETKNVLTDNMHICRPILIIQFALFFRCIAKGRNIVWKCVNPHVHDMSRVKLNRNTPCKARSWHAQILQSRL